MEDDSRDCAAVWASIDPRSGEVVTYPAEAAQLIERAFQAGGRQTVSLTGAGGHTFLNGISIELTGLMQATTQRSSKGGRRDVRRIPVAPEASSVTVHTVQESRAWHLADFSAPGVTRDRELRFSAVAIVGQGFTADYAKERMQQAEQARSDGLVALWEWCRVAGPCDPTALGPELWGLYTDEQNEQIEASFRGGAQNALVTVGIRSYEILFEGSHGGVQIDRGLRKKRLVRRRLLKPAEATAIFAEVAASNEVAEGECPVCYEDYCSTTNMPVMSLVPCGHSFHAACMQEIADKQGNCPMCRADVNWKTTLRAR